MTGPALLDELVEHPSPGFFEVRRIAGDVRREDNTGLEQIACPVGAAAQAHRFVHQVLDLVAGLDVALAKTALHFAKKCVGRRNLYLRPKCLYGPVTARRGSTVRALS